MRVNPKNFNQGVQEARELRERKSVQQARAIRRNKRANRICRQCGGDCHSLMLGIQASLNGGRA